MTIEKLILLLVILLAFLMIYNHYRKDNFTVIYTKDNSKAWGFFRIKGKQYKWFGEMYPY